MDLVFLILGLCLSWWLLPAISYLVNGGGKSSITGKPPPGPRPLPIIGNLFELGSLPHRSLAKLARVHGPIISLKLGRITTVVVSTASMAREILQIHDESFSNRMPPDSITPFRHDELGIPWLAISPLWRKLRRISNVHLLARKSLDSNQCLRYRKIEELLSHVGKFRETGKPVNIAEAAFTTTLNLLGNTMFSMDLAEGSTSESAMELKELIWQIMVEAGRPNIADYFPVLKRVDPYGAKRRMTEYFGRMFKVIDRIIDERRQVRAASGSDRKSDMLDILLDLSEHEEDMDLFTLKHLFLVSLDFCGRFVWISVDALFDSMCGLAFSYY
ncbi:hypothetical protein SAY86_028014 [Trapa natans]|uniref:Uncharacterized protein n=1 Tax=Trapa natans TaxID=22666 RepID=A0AAN7LU12_TRANT|nr:hypothetical protein SAY86_028014 [Trapa natans]